MISLLRTNLYASKKFYYGRHIICWRSPPFPYEALAKIYISVLLPFREAYEDLTRDGFIETVSGKGSFVASQNREFIQEEQLRIAEELLQGRRNWSSTWH